MKESIWIVVGNSESGDHYTATFRQKPTEEQLSVLAHVWDGDKAKDGPGYDGSYVYLEVKEERVR